MIANILLGLILLCVVLYVVYSLRDTWDDDDVRDWHENPWRVSRRVTATMQLIAGISVAGLAMTATDSLLLAFLGGYVGGFLIGNASFALLLGRRS